MSTPSTHSRCDVRGGRKRSKAESVVFWQAFWYVVSFLLTWVIYLVGQFRPYFSTNDQGLYAFWIILLALNPLMGFWNAFVYAKPWTWKRKKKEGLACCHGTTKLICCVGRRRQDEVPGSALPATAFSITSEVSLPHDTQPGESAVPEQFQRVDETTDEESGILHDENSDRKPRSPSIEAASESSFGHG
jgi:hypothetical protein